MRYAFLGTSTFAVAILEKLHSDFFYPIAVITQPDRPAGRKRDLLPSPVKIAAQHHSLPILQPERIASIAEDLKAMDLDLLIVAAYGQIVPREILASARLGAINVHGSLLPRHRGASPIQAAILAGDTETGVTIMLMDEKMDHGDILFEKSLPIAATDTYRSLHTKLATLGAEVTAKILPDFLAGRLKPVPQPHEQATYTKRIDKNAARISWNDSAMVNDRKIRAFYDWPLAWTILPNGKKMNIISAVPVQLQDASVPAGMIVMDKNACAIACSSGAMLLKDIQIEGKPKTTGEIFARGYHALHGQFCT